MEAPLYAADALTLLTIVTYMSRYVTCLGMSRYVTCLGMSRYVTCLGMLHVSVCNMSRYVANCSPPADYSYLPAMALSQRGTR